MGRSSGQTRSVSCSTPRESARFNRLEFERGGGGEKLVATSRVRRRCLAGSLSLLCSHRLLQVPSFVSMTSATIKFGALVTLQEFNSSSPHFKQGASLRVTGKLQDYSVESAIAVIVDGSATLKVDTQHVSLNLRIGSIYQFIGELLIQPNNEAVLKARVGRNVDGIDLNLYHQSLQLLREFQAEQISRPAP